MKKVALIHTVKSVAKSFDDELLKHLPNIQIYNIWDEFIVKNLSGKDQFQEEDYNRLLDLLKLAESTNVDYIFVTCSSLSIAIDKLKHLITVPIFKIDEAMLTTAVLQYNNITILATAESTIIPTTEQLLEIAKQEKKDILIESYVVPKALEALKSGDIKKHDALICEHVQNLKNKEVILLAQASMAHLEKVVSKIGACTVLSSPRLAIELLVNKLL